MENERNKPGCPLIGQDGNVFNLIGIASRTLKENGMAAEASEMSSRVLLQAAIAMLFQSLMSMSIFTSSEDMDEDIDAEYEENFGMEIS